MSGGPAAVRSQRKLCSLAPARRASRPVSQTISLGALIRRLHISHLVADYRPSNGWFYAHANAALPCNTRLLERLTSDSPPDQLAPGGVDQIDYQRADVDPRHLGRGGGRAPAAVAAAIGARGVAEVVRIDSRLSGDGAVYVDKRPGLRTRR